MKRTGLLWLTAALCILFLGWFLTEKGRAVLPAEDYATKLEAARRTERCFEAIRRWKEERGIPLDETADRNGTGLIGPEYTAITTTLGNLEAKRTSTNPNMAAVFVDMLGELGLREGDWVAVNCSASFPALNIAALCAIEAMGLRSIRMISFGASTYGATDPDMTYPDMEAYLCAQGLIAERSRYFSIGGNLDIGTEMPDAVKDEIIARLTGLGYELWYREDIVENVTDRHAYYLSQGDIRCLINVGGNDVSFGDSSAMVHTDGGLLTELAVHDNTLGLIQLFLRDRIPVIHMLNIRTLAADYGLPIDPSPLPPPGSGGLYYKDRYPAAYAAAALILATPCIILGGVRLKKKSRADSGVL